jgi:hypothetical protein
MQPHVGIENEGLNLNIYLHLAEGEGSDGLLRPGIGLEMRPLIKLYRRKWVGKSAFTDTELSAHPELLEQYHEKHRKERRSRGYPGGMGKDAGANSLS